jgi:hypothetical protein
MKATAAIVLVVAGLARSQGQQDVTGHWQVNGSCVGQGYVPTNFMYLAQCSDEVIAASVECVIPCAIHQHFCSRFRY